MPRRKGKGRAANRGREIPAIALTRRDIEAQGQAIREAQQNNTTQEESEWQTVQGNSAMT